MSSGKTGKFLRNVNLYKENMIQHAQSCAGVQLAGF